MTVSFHPAAEQEYFEAVDYYEGREPGLGSEFAAELVFAVDRVLSHPQAWPVIEAGVRRALLRRYPYGVVYAIADDAIIDLRHRKPFTGVLIRVLH